MTFCVCIATFSLNLAFCYFHYFLFLYFYHNLCRAYSKVIFLGQRLLYELRNGACWFRRSFLENQEEIVIDECTTCICEVDLDSI